MTYRKLQLQDVLTGDKCSDDNLKLYTFESFAKEIDYQRQTELLTELILDHFSISKQLEQLNKELTYSREVLAEAQEIALLGRWDIDIAKGTLVWSESMYSILEIDTSISASPDLFLDLVHPDDLEQVTKLYEGMYTIKKPWSTRYRLLMKDGRIKWVQLRFHTKLNENGTPAHIYGTIQDITEEKTIEDQLEQYNHQLERLVEEKVQEITSSQTATIFALIKLSESRDGETGAHIERTASFCRLLAQKARCIPEYSDMITDTFVDTIYRASPLHDIGKVGIPDQILLKPGKLTPEETAIMKTHVQIGYDTLSKVGQQYDKNYFLSMGMEIAQNHHEKWDGSGYNKGLKGNEIPFSARIMALSDVYDALRSKRVYKDAYSHEKSLEIILSSRGSHFDPLLVDLFAEHHKEFQELYDSYK